MPDDMHDTEDSLETSWAQLGHQVSAHHDAHEPMSSNDLEALQNWLLYMSVEITTDRTAVTLRRDIIRIAIHAGLNPADIPERVFQQDRDLSHRRTRATEFGYVPRPEASTKLGRAVLDTALRLGTTNNRIAASEELTNLARRLR
ncbi:MAG: hypothetical protein HYZ29_00915 [Myxococcales bacterium]|nr:hypothetical protein [Myxococcales bacterium]